MNMISASQTELVTSQLGIDLDSPVSWLHYQGDSTSTTTHPPKPYYSFLDDHDHDRGLESNDEYTDVLVDDDGNEYEPYSLAWRYLGMFIECEEQDDDDDDDGDDRRRHLSSDDGNNNGCARKVLWAAVSRMLVLYIEFVCFSFLSHTSTSSILLLYYVVPRPRLQWRVHWRVSILQYFHWGIR